jgi:hypothetical protein
MLAEKMAVVAHLPAPAGKFLAKGIGQRAFYTPLVVAKSLAIGGTVDQIGFPLFVRAQWRMST